MESSVSSIDAGIRPWRTATFVAGTVAVVELLALIAIGTVFLGPSLFDRSSSRSRGATRSAAPASKKHRAETPKPVVKAHVKQTPAAVRPKLLRSQTSVVVLNGNGISGAAAATAQTVKARHYRVASVGNAPRSDYARSIVMYRPGFRGEGLRLGQDLGIRLVTPLDGLRRRQLDGAQVALVIGAS